MKVYTLSLDGDGDGDGDGECGIREKEIKIENYDAYFFSGWRKTKKQVIKEALKHRTERVKIAEADLKWEYENLIKLIKLNEGLKHG